MKKDIFLSTRKNITAISTIIVLICLIIFAIITQTLYSAKVLDKVDHQLLEQQQFMMQKECDIYSDNTENFKISDVPKKEFDGDEKGNLPENFQSRPYDKPVRIPPNLIIIIYNDNKFYNMSNNLYFSEDNLPVFPKDSYGKIVTLENNDYIFRGIYFNVGEYKLEILANIDSEMNSINGVRRSIIFSLIILIIVAIIFSTYLASRVIKPIKEAYEKQVYFVQDASHEMRTPLAVIKGKLELLANSWGDKIDDHFEHISKMMSEVRGLEKLNSDLLLLSKEDLDLSVNISEFYLDDFINDVSEFYIDLAEIKEKNFNVIKPEKEIKVEWDYNKIKRAVIILIENAFKYTNEKGHIQLIVEEFNKNIKITVKDDGIGIKQEEQKRIFDRFYRSEGVRGKNISGTGIGLSLLKSISKNFGIKLKVNSEDGKGSEFILVIPKAIK